MHRALYRKWRPLTFDDVVGQEHITRVLSNEVESGRVCHAYLFCGSRGTGKTTCAKILAKAVNCENPVNGNPCGKCAACISVENQSATDILEMDAASNTGVDYIRDIKSEVVYSPSMLKNRVYIIDEVHMLTDSAFNALLKTLEEPPENVIFILATTEKQKVPATILSRCQKFDFRRIPTDIIADRLMYIAKNEGIMLEDAAAHLIARLSCGGMRDAISLLELCSSEADSVDSKAVAVSAGVVGRDLCTRTVRAIHEKSNSELFAIVGEIYYSSSDIAAFWNELMNFYRDMLVVKSVKKAESEQIRKDILDITETEFSELVELAAMFSVSELIYHSGILEDAYVNSIGKPGADRRLAAEMTLMRMVDPSSSLTLEALSSRISSVEAKLLSISSRGYSTGLSEKTENAEKQEPENRNQQNNHEQHEIKTEQNKTKKDSAESTAMPDFAEIVGIYRTDHSSSAPFLDGARASIDSEGNVSILVGSSIAKMMLDGDDASRILLGIILSKGYKATKVTIVLANTEKNTGSDDVFG